MCIEYSVAFTSGLPPFSDIIQMVEIISGLSDFEYSDSMPISVSHDLLRGSSVDIRESTYLGMLLTDPNTLAIDAFSLPTKYLEAVIIHACIRLGGVYSNDMGNIEWGSKKWEEIPTEIKAKLI